MTRLLNSTTVVISAGHRRYSQAAPYCPSKHWPEYPFGAETLSEHDNPAYEAVRSALHLLDLDTEHYDGRNWNPLAAIINPGDTVVLKPNFVRHFRETHAGLDDCVITHGSIIRAVADYVYIALQGKGRIIIADAPQNDADFNAIREITQLQTLQDFYHRYADLDLEVYDLRPEAARKIDGIIVGHEPLAGDPAGFVKVNLAYRSAFAEINHLCHLLYGSEYDTGELFSHQHDDVHEYLICKTVLDADCVISLPKLKTHKKVALTVNLKNLVGINGNKNWLPHHREGAPAQGGDQFPDDVVKNRIERALAAKFKRIFPLLGPARAALARPVKAVGKALFGDTNVDKIRSGNWYGNDTAWRMVVDLNRILYYADAAGRLHDRPVRRFLSIVDGVIAGEGNGPLDPTPRHAGIVLAGFNPVAVDLACARLMGFDYQKIPMLRAALADHELPLTAFDYDDITCRSNHEPYDRRLADFQGPCLAFTPHFGWKGHVEIAQRPHEESLVS